MVSKASGKRVAVLLLAVLLLGAAWAATLTVPGHTMIVLVQEGKESPLFAAVARDPESLTLTWRNSQFGLDVTEGFVTADGLIIQDRVTFALPNGPPPPRVSPGEVADLFHTGGPFDARGLSRPLSRIVYRIGEIGNPRLRLQGRSIAFRQEAGFGGRITLTASRATAYEWLADRFFAGWGFLRSAAAGAVRSRPDGPTHPGEDR